MIKASRVRPIPENAMRCWEMVEVVVWLCLKIKTVVILKVEKDKITDIIYGMFFHI